MPIELDFSYHSGARIRVIGVGGAGGNAVRTMMSRGLEHVEFIAANTDSQALMRNPAPTKIQLGNGSTRGLGAGAKPDVGRSAVEESLDEVRDALIGSDMVFVTAGMGGGTGTGAAPIIAREAHELGALVVGIVTRPFSFENKQRAKIAEQGIREMREAVDALIVIPNDRILSVVDASVPFRIALEKADEVLYNATRGIADIIHAEGIVNVDFADVVTVMKNQGDAMMGIGIGSGERRAMEAAQNALNSPILEGMQIYGAQGLLV
ncbi:MAG: cell division protein FtsZ, partial [Ignavibacteriae bacterium]